MSVAGYAQTPPVDPPSGYDSYVPAPLSCARRTPQAPPPWTLGHWLVVIAGYALGFTYFAVLVYVLFFAFSE